MLDTNAISEIRRGRDTRVRAWAQAAGGAELYLSVLTLGEIRTGIDRLQGRDPVAADSFSRWLGELRRRFEGRILPVDALIAEWWGQLNAPASHNTVDSLLAATAHVHGLTVVTRNTKDFQGCGVPLLNPWEYEPPQC